MGTGVSGGSRKRRLGNFPLTVGQPGRLGDWVQYWELADPFQCDTKCVRNMKQSKTSVTFCKPEPDFFTETHWAVILDIHQL